MSLENLISAGPSIGAVAINLVRQFINNPIVGGVPIQATRFECVMEAEVSRHVLVNLQQGLQNVMDNVAPGPRTWEIEGYVGGLPGELTSLFMPSLLIMTRALDAVFNSRRTTTLIHPTSTMSTVMISRFSYSYDPAVANRIPVKISLVEVTILTAEVGPSANVPAEQASASPVPGQANAAPAPMGSTPAQSQALPATVGF